VVLMSSLASFPETAAHGVGDTAVDLHPNLNHLFDRVLFFSSSGVTPTSLPVQFLALASIEPSIELDH
jgi:hypothetical protein